MAKAKKARKEYSKDDTGRAQRFKDFAEARVTRALRAIGSVGKLSGRSYKSTAEQREKIKSALQSALDRAVRSLDGSTPTDGFTL